VTRIEIDEETLAAAKRLSGPQSEEDLVNLALREYVARRTGSGARLRHFAAAQRWDDQDFWRRHTAEKAPG
jgi:Arc/MetJ family transcription regulator